MSLTTRILDFNFVTQSNAAVTATSEDVNFPVSNLRSFIRTKVWRSTGNFVIDATNDKLDFEDVGSSELTATLTQTTYTPADLATHIAAQMAAVGANVYTVTYNTATGKWNITTDGAFLSLLTNTGTNVATDVYDSIGFDTTVDQTGALTYDGARIAIHTEEAVIFDIKTTEALDSFIVLFDTIRGVQLTNQAVFKIQGNSSPDFTSPTFEQTFTIDDDFLVASIYLTSAQSFRFWRVQVVDPENSDLFVELPKVIIAEATTLSTNPAPDIGFKFTTQDFSRIQRTPFGHHYADVFPNRKSMSFTYNNMGLSDMQTLQGIYDSVGAVTPITIVLDPEEELFDKDRFFIYGVLSGRFRLDHQVTDIFSLPLAIEEVL